MFGINPLNYGNISSLMAAEGRLFMAQASPSIFDQEPQAGNEGNYTTVNWDENASSEGGRYRFKFANGSGGMGWESASAAINWLNNTLTISKGHGIKFEALSPDDEAANEEEEEEEEDESLECPQEDCPEGTLAVLSTDADGVETCRCVETGDIGEGLGKIGMGLGALALVPIAVAGIVVFGIVKLFGSKK